MNRQKKCSACYGLGTVREVVGEKICNDCGGNGIDHYHEDPEPNSHSAKSYYPCNRCNGLGRCQITIKRDCHQCGGTGKF